MVNNNGDMLTSVVDENFAESGGQFEYQRNYERDVEAKVISMLEPVVGKGKVKVRVAASFDFTKTEKTEEKYDPDSQVARSEQRSTEKSTGGTSGGVPGVASNLPGRQQTAAALPGTPAVSEKKSETINYELTKTVSHVVSPTGEIKKLSAVVLVDGTYAAVQGSTEKKYAPRTEDEVRQFEDMVKKAVGFSADRGDEVKVVNLPFEVVPQEEMEEAQAPSQVMPTVMTASKYVVPLIGVVLLFLVRHKTAHEDADRTIAALPAATAAQPAAGCRRRHAEGDPGPGPVVPRAADRLGQEESERCDEPHQGMAGREIIVQSSKYTGFRVQRQREPGKEWGMPLSGYEKAAVFLSSLGEDAAAEVLKGLDVKDIGRITMYMTRLKTLSTGHDR